jgi:hypothetical protein
LGDEAPSRAEEVERLGEAEPGAQLLPAALDLELGRSIGRSGGDATSASW